MSKKLGDIPYINILKDSWKLTWSKKYLWWLGLLASFTSGTGNFSNYSSPGDNDKIGDFIAQNMQTIIIIGSIFFVICLVMFFIGIIGRAGLIKNIADEINSRPGNFKSGFTGGKKFFWKILGLNIILFLIMITSIVVLAVPVIFLFAKKVYFLGTMLALLAVFILLPVIILVSFAKTYGEIYIVLGKLTALSAIESAYNLFRKNILPSIIMALLTIPVGMILMFAIIFMLIPTALFFGLIGLLFYFLLGKTGAIIIAVIALLFFLALALLLRSIYETILQTVWILFFYEIAKPKVEERAAVEETKEEKPETMPETSPVKTIEN